jgi:hypothetical protein
VTKVQTGDYELSGPYTHENLAVFLVHGNDSLKDANILTLEEALEQKKVIVHETQNVNSLAIENTSSEDVFIQAGDIVKGGQQDRVIGTDLIVSAGSGKIPLEAFCVEAGRWTRRGSEDAGKFAHCPDQLCNNSLKFSVRKARSQKEVWDNVSNTQANLSKVVGSDVKAAMSDTSLQLTLEDDKLQKAVEAYVQKLSDLGDKDKDVIGYVVVINGKVNNADVYASHTLFRKLWPKLLKASAVEAVGEQQQDKKFDPVGADALKTFLAEVQKGKTTTKEVDARCTLVEVEGARNVLFETRDKTHDNAVVRRSYLAKQDEEKSP